MYVVPSLLHPGICLTFTRKVTRVAAFLGLNSLFCRCQVMLTHGIWMPGGIGKLCRGGPACEQLGSTGDLLVRYGRVRLQYRLQKSICIGSFCHLLGNPVIACDQWYYILLESHITAVLLRNIRSYCPWGVEVVVQLAMSCSNPARPFAVLWFHSRRLNSLSAWVFSCPRFTPWQRPSGEDRWTVFSSRLAFVKLAELKAVVPNRVS